MKDKNPTYPGLLEDIIFGLQHDAFDDEWSQALLRCWKTGALDEDTAKMLQGKTHDLKMDQQFGNLDPFRRPRMGKGELVLGLDQARQAVAFRIQWLVAGMLIIANTGGGKTNLLISLLLQLARLSIRFWTTDLYKRQLRHLMPMVNKLGQPMIILRPQQWVFNLLQAGRRDPQTHLSTVIDLMVRALDLPPRASSILRQAGWHLYHQFGIWDGRRGEWPTLSDLYEWLYGHRALNAAAREAILDRLGALLVSLTPASAAYRLAWEATDLARYSIIFEMCGAAESVKQLLPQANLFALFQNEVDRGVVNGPLKQVVAFEDSQRFFTSGKGGGEVAAMDELAGVIRSTGIGICALVQSLEDFSPRLLPNLSTKIMGRLGSHADWQRMAANLAMNSEQQNWARRHLSPGQFIAQAPEGDWREPFRFIAPHMRMNPSVSDTQATQSVRILDALPIKKADEFFRWTPRHVVEIYSKSPAGSGGGAVTPTPPVASAPAAPASSPVPCMGLTDAHRRLIAAVLDEPGKPSGYYSRKLGMSGKRIALLRGQLVADGYLREHHVATGKRGRAAIVLEPLPAATRMIGK